MGFLAALALGLALPAAAQDLTSSNGWRWSADGSLTDTSGNSYARAWNGSTTLEGVRGRFGGAAVFKAAQGHDRDSITAEKFTSWEKGRAHFTEVGYVFEKFLWKRDRFALIRAQYDLCAGLGARVLNLKRDELNLEIGGGEIFEHRIGVENNRADTVRGHVSYQHTFGLGSMFTAETEHTRNMRYDPDWHWRFSSALNSPVGKRLNLQFTYDYEYANNVPSGVSRVDRTIGASLGLRFGKLQDFDETTDYSEMDEYDEAPDPPPAPDAP